VGAAAPAPHTVHVGPFGRGTRVRVAGCRFDSNVGSALFVGPAAEGNSSGAAAGSVAWQVQPGQEDDAFAEVEVLGTTFTTNRAGTASDSGAEGPAGVPDDGRRSSGGGALVLAGLPPPATIEAAIRALVSDSV
jgi:hypothetical protein